MVANNCELADEVDLILNEGQECDIDDDCAFSVPGDANNWKCIAAPCPGGNCISRDKCKRCSKASHSRLLPPELELTTISTDAPTITTEKPTTVSSNLLRTTTSPSTTNAPVVEVRSTIADDLNNSIPDTMATTTSADGIHSTVSTVGDIEDITITNAPIDLFNNVTSIVTDDNIDNITESTSTVSELETDAPNETTTTRIISSTDAPEVVVNSGTLLIPLIRPNTAAANGN